MVTLRPGRRLRGQRTLLLDALQAAVDCRESRREVYLVPGRRWRADLAWPAHRVAVELQGGLYVGGHHVRGQEYERDCEKMLYAAAEGWRVIPLTWGMLIYKLPDVAQRLDRILGCTELTHR